jgi:putative transposase
MVSSIVDTPEQIINKLLKAKILAGEGYTISAIIEKLGVSKTTYFRWCNKYSNMTVDQYRELRALRQENIRLKLILLNPQLEDSRCKETSGEIPRPN